MSKFKEVLAAKNISQNELARILHNKYPAVDKSLISKIVNGLIIPGKELMNDIRLILKCSGEELSSCFEYLDAKNNFVENKGVATPLKLKPRNKSYRLNVNLSLEDKNKLLPKELIMAHGSITDFIKYLLRKELDNRGQEERKR